jgi:hypothetical protein
MSPVHYHSTGVACAHLAAATPVSTLPGRTTYRGYMSRNRPGAVIVVSALNRQRTTPAADSSRLWTAAAVSGTEGSIRLGPSGESTNFQSRAEHGIAT